MATPGIVTTLRINPTDQMSVVDVLDLLGVSKQNLSFAQATKTVLSAFLESMRQEGKIPRREGFEYTEMLKPFTDDQLGTHAQKVRLARALSLPPPETGLDAAKSSRLNELMFRHEQDPQNMDQAELAELAGLLSEAQ